MLSSFFETKTVASTDSGDNGQSPSTQVLERAVYRDTDAYMYKSTLRC